MAIFFFFFKETNDVYKIQWRSPTTETNALFLNVGYIYLYCHLMIYMILIALFAYLGFRNLENSVQTVCGVAEVIADEAAVALAYCWCNGVLETEAGQLSRFPTFWWCRVDDCGEAYRTKSPKLHTPLAVIEKLRRRYSSRTGPSGLGTFPKLDWNIFRWKS